MQGMFGGYCFTLLVTTAASLPAFPILQGPWNAPAATSSWTTSSSSTRYPSLEISSTTTAAAFTLSASSRISSSSSIRRALDTSSSTSSCLSTSSVTSSRGGGYSKPSTSVTSRHLTGPGGSHTTSSTTLTSASLNSEGIRSGSPNTITLSTGLTSSSIAIKTQSHTLGLQAASPLAATASSSSGFYGTRPPFPTASKPQSLDPTSSIAVAGHTALNSSIISTPVSSTLSALASSLLVPSTSITNSSALSAASPSLNACGAVTQYYNPTPKDWTDHNTDAWLNNWVGDNVGPIAANANGFTGAFATWAVGNPDFSCRDDGSPTDCDFNPCNIPILNAKGVDVRPTYYVMESLTRIHTYFTGLRESFTVAGIATALSKDNWAKTFYEDKDDKSVIALREVMNVLAMIVGIAAALTGIGGLVAGTIAAVAATVYNGAAGSITPTLGQHTDDTFTKSADLGGILGEIVVGAIESFTSANNILMHGQNYDGTGDLRDYFRGGAFVDYPGIDKNAVTNTMNAFLIGQAINQLYRQQKIFIMGGGACGDNQGIGQGPQANSVCRNGQAWYLYWWQENNVISLTMHQWGWVSPPPGSDQLGQGDYALVTVQDIINSSLDAYNVAGYNYNNVTAYQRAQSAITEQWANPAAQGASWEGTFTIPVCDVSAAVNSSYYDKAWILEDYGHDSRPVWCGPVCSGDVQKTRDFIAAANMNNFESPRHLCDDDTEGNWWFPPP